MLKNLNKIVLYVKDLTSSSSFYKKLGFQVGTSDKVVVISLPDFTIEAVTGPTEEDMQHSNKEINSNTNGSGVFFLIEVDNVDLYYEELIAIGFKPSTIPKTWGWGRREFVLRDPDGYKLVFYQPA